MSDPSTVARQTNEHVQGQTQVTQDYLKVIVSAEEWGDGGISVSDLAARMGVVASTASENVRRLTEAGLVDHRPYQKVHLTRRGREVAVAMVRRHRILETYLFEKLDFDWDEVHREAEVLEHAISDTLLEHLDRALGYPFRDPHGDPIPAIDGTWFAPPKRSLDDLPVGDHAVVVRISDASSDMLRDLEGRGIVLDAVVRVEARSHALGTTRLRVTPPPGWHVRGAAPSSESDGGFPAQGPTEVELGTVATSAIFVGLGEGPEEPTLSGRVG